MPTSPARGVKIIVGVDYGTTFSGVAIVTKSGRNNTETPEPILSWPNPKDAASSFCKVPSRVAYLEENDRKDDYVYTRSTWGYEVQAGWQSYTWTKLLLDRNTRPTEWDDPDLYGEQARLNQGIMKLPAGKTPLEVCTDYLKHLYKHIISELEASYKAAFLKTTPIEFWFTHPAIWSPEAKNATVTAARNAGFGERQGVHDTLNLISEPEAAAIATLRSSDDTLHDLKTNSGILICDVGGGTVDITTYRVRRNQSPQAYSTLKVDELCTGEGGKCGSTMIDRNFHTLMREKFGDAFTTLPAGKIGPGSKFMREFETFKKGFDGNVRLRYPLTLRMPRLQRNQALDSYYDWEDAEITLTGHDMKKCFDPVIEKIIHLLESQLAVVKARKSTPIETIILVGGFADSVYLWNRIKEWRDLYFGGIDVLTPKKSPWSAIARGAALRGLDGSLVLKRQCRRHYGISTSKEWNDARDREDPEHKTWIHGRTGKRWTTDCMHWFLKKDTELIPGSESHFEHIEHLREADVLENSPYEIKIYSCPLHEAPEKWNPATVQPLGKVSLNLKDVNLKECLSWSERNRTMYEINLKTYVIPEGTETGLMDLRVVWKDRDRRERRCGKAKLKFAVE